MQHQGTDFGSDLGFHMPIFDIKVSAQKKNVYTKISQNELSVQLYQMGAFNPQMADQVLMMLDMMEFDGKDGLMQKIAQNATLFKKLIQYMQMALEFANAVRPDMVEAIAQDIMQTLGQSGGGGMMGGSTKMFESDHIAGIGKKEPTIVANSRERAAGASQPDSGKVTKGDKK